MPLLFNYLKIPDCFIGYDMPVCQKIEYQMQRISVHFTNDCIGNQLYYNNDLPALETRIMHCRNFSKQTFWCSNPQSETANVICLLLSGQGSRQRCDPMHPIMHSNIIFDIKFLATIKLSWNLLKCILW